MDEERSVIFLIVLIAVALLGFEIYSFSYISKVRANNYEQLEEASEKIEEYRAKKEALVEKGEKKEAVCYVDGVKQDTDFDPDGLNLDNYEVEYKENRLYFKKVTNSQDSTSQHTSFSRCFCQFFTDSLGVRQVVRNGILIPILYWRFEYERKNFSKLHALYWEEEAVLFNKKACYS